MLVLQFAFDGGPDNPYLPANHVPNAVVYTGTHDNDTTAGWWASLDRRARTRARSVTGRKFTRPAIDLAETAFASPASLAILPMQDLLELGPLARMNTPGTAEANWAWRLESGQVGPALAEAWRRRVDAGGRLPVKNSLTAG
jgi:4-alpha-glucanotransferase